MDDIAFGRLVKLARIRRGWRQRDLADRAGVSRTMVSRIERGHLGTTPLDVVRAVAAQLGIRVEVAARARAVDLDRVVNARHAALAEHVVGWLPTLGDWILRAEVSFSEYGERGVIDVLAWHAASRTLLVIEIKTELIDFGELLGKLDVKERLAVRVGRRFGWQPLAVGVALLVADSMTNRRRAADHRALLRTALPADGRALLRWLKKPSGELRALRFVSDAREGHVRYGFASPARVRTRKSGAAAA
jgi:transcriptional regulator with XRE-family HTH domain